MSFCLISHRLGFVDFSRLDEGVADTAQGPVLFRGPGKYMKGEIWDTREYVYLWKLKSTGGGGAVT